MSKNFSKLGVVAVVAIVCSLAIAIPAKAFYMEVPQFAKDAWKMLKSLPAGAQESTSDSNTVTDRVEPPINQEQPMNPEQPTQPAPVEKPAPLKCIINGQEMPMSSCPEMNQQPVNQPQQPRYEGGSEGGGQNWGPGPGDRNEEEMKKQEARQIKDMQRGVKQTENQLKRFEIDMKSAIKRGAVIPQEVTDKIAQAKELIKKIKAATTMEEMGETPFDELNTLMMDLEQVRQDIFEKAMRLDGLKRGLKGMSQGIKMYDKQIAKLIKQKITIPAEIADNLAKIKAMIDVINKAKSWDEVEEAGVEEIHDLMMTLDENRDQLEMLARWPQTLKQLNREVKNLQSALKKAKTTVAKLQKKEIDLTSNYDQFAAAVDKIIAVRDEAVAKMAAGESREAFDLLEENFFGQMEDVWQYQRIIDTMNNMGRFNSDFKKGLAEAQKVIKKLQKQKVDVTEVTELLNQAKEKGQEVIALMKAKPIDEEAILAALEDFEMTMQEFENKMEELGVAPPSGPMPWEQGGQQFKQIQMSKGVTQYLPPKKAEPQQPVETMPAPMPNGGGETVPANGGGQTCNINGQEMPGPCSNYE